MLLFTLPVLSTLTLNILTGDKSAGYLSERVLINRGNIRNVTISQRDCEMILGEKSGDSSYRRLFLV